MSDAPFRAIADARQRTIVQLQEQLAALAAERTRLLEEMDKLQRRLIATRQGKLRAMQQTAHEREKAVKR